MTGYGSPLAYARVVDLLSQSGVTTLEGWKLLDFGYGTIGHLRLLGLMGADAHGVDVEPIFEALYSEPGDTGRLPQTREKPQNGGGTSMASGTVSIHTGRWPSESGIITRIGSGYDVITSKNTLKAGYIHPAREVDERFLVKLGVSDEVYLQTARDSLKPGGLLVIYNISPAQNPPDKPYLPHADGRSPFTREQFGRAGFEVLAFDVDDQNTIIDYWLALGYDEGKTREELRDEIFAWYTIVRRKS
jgi:hypothetical protein